MTGQAVRLYLPVALAMLAEVGGAQGASPPRRGIGGITISGYVFDSVGRSPLGSSIVHLVSSDSAGARRVAVADSLGRYRFDDVVRGRYVIGFFHPMLDSLTLQPLLRELEVGGNLSLSVDLAIPSGYRLGPAFCGSRAMGRTASALVGALREARTGQPIGGATVVAEWLDMVVGRGGTQTHPSHMVTTTTANGWFALCGVPAPGTVGLRAIRAADSTDRIEVQIASDGFARRDLYLAPEGSGAGTVSGRITSINGTPIADAIVSVARGARTRTNEAGEWTLPGLPLGTRQLEVRAIGFYPDRRPVHVVPDAAFVRVQLEVFESVLDTVRVRTSALRAADDGGFDRRRFSLGTGKFITEADIARRGPIETSDLFKGMAGMRTDDGITMRGAFSQVGTMGDCTPAVFLDGRLLPPVLSLKSDDLDMWVRPSEIMGIEVYHDAPPPQFQMAQSGCGSIVIWTKRRTTIKRP